MKGVHFYMSKLIVEEKKEIYNKNEKESCFQG